MKKLIIDLLKINPLLPQFHYLNIQTEVDLDKYSNDELLDLGGNLAIDIEDENLYHHEIYREHYDNLNREYLKQRPGTN